MSVPKVVDSLSTTTPAKQKPRRSYKRNILLSFILVGMVSSLAAGIYWWSEHKYEYFPKRWGVVVPGKIYRSGQLTPQLLGKTLKKHGITTIIDLQLYDIQDAHQMTEVQYAAEHGLTLHRFPLAGDGTGKVSSYVDSVSTLIQCVEANEPILVHCAAGTQRTGGIVACYRLLVEGADPSDVYAELKRYEWEPKGDRELVEYVNQNLPSIAQQLVERGLLERVPSPMPRLEE